MVKNRSPDPVKRTNLIIAPLALLDQWKLEIETKTNCGVRVLIYHGASTFVKCPELILNPLSFPYHCAGSNRPRRKSDLQEYDVILTTYGVRAKIRFTRFFVTRSSDIYSVQTMAMEWPDFEKEAKKKEKAKRQKKRDDFLGDFIVDDSSDGEDLGTKVKKRKQACKFIQNCLPFSCFSMHFSAGS